VSSPVLDAQKMDAYAERILKSPDQFTVEQVAAARRFRNALARVRRLTKEG
jgi:hypothetical protein